MFDTTICRVIIFDNLSTKTAIIYIRMVGLYGRCSPFDEYDADGGQLASTTGNIYGVYDMSGGAYEDVMGGYAISTSESLTSNYLRIAVRPPYIDLYTNPPFSGDNITNNNSCTWEICGGHALHETKTQRPVSENNQSWGNDYSYFVDTNTPWFPRGGYGGNSEYAGIFASYYSTGFTYNAYGFRVALLTIPQE